MLSIFTYENYRDYLAEYYKERKSIIPGFSYQVFSDKAGFSNKSFIFLVIRGKKNLSRSSVIKISQAIGHRKTEQEYFANLVGLNQAKTLKEKNYYFEKLSQVKYSGSGFAGAKLIRKNQYNYLSKWYNVVIKSLINLMDFKDDYAGLAKTLYPAILPKQAKKTVKQLHELGLIKRMPSGRYVPVNKTLSTGREISSLAALNFHSEMAKLAEYAIQELPKNKRFLTGLTLDMSKKSYDLICDKMEQFVSESLEIAEKDKESDLVYQINFQMFPVSHPVKKRRL